ncbi:MAG TPA: ABC transporter permease [Candidatus Cybelea sp.]|nr:ABC transporter permease [Candidatus Cybelea sp.]
MRRISNIFWLGTKELRSFGHDTVLLAFVVYCFSFAIYSQATGVSHELRNASIAIVDEDQSNLSRSIVHAFLSPYFKKPEAVSSADVDARMDDGRNTFAVDVPPNFEADVAAGRSPAFQVNVDATAMMQAGIGAGYIQQIVSDEVYRFLHGTDIAPASPVALQMRVAFNPGLETPWFVGVMALLNNINMLAIILAGAAVIREREHGTMDHLLVMPITSLEIAAAKVWANGLVIAVCAALSLWFVVHELLGLPIVGSLPLFLAGLCIYLFFATAVGIFLGTVARSMPQLGLLFILIVLPMNLLSGSNTPFESMPLAVQYAMQPVPSTHFVAIAQAILYRGAGFDIVWPHFVAVGTIGALFFVLALLRFRATTSQSIA